jgi:DNA-binding beta-propeller fold protein YncE
MGCSSISVRGLAAMAAACAVLCAAAGSASAAPLIWVPNSDPSANAILTFDGATGEEVGKPIPVGAEPHALAVTPSGRRVVVETSGGKTAVVVNTVTRKAFEPIDLLGNGQEVAISPDGSVAYVTEEPDHEVQVIDPETGTLRGGIDVGADSLGVAFDPDGEQAYVGTPNGIVTIDTETEKVVGSPIDVGGTAQRIAFTPDGKTAYVAVREVNDVVVVDTALGQVVGEIPMPDAPDSVTMSPDGKKLYVSTAGSPTGTLRVIATAIDAEVGKPIDIPQGPRELAITPDGKAGWAAGPNEVTPINLVSGKVGTPISIKESAVFGIAITPDQSPIPAFAAPSNVFAGTPASFSGAASTDPDGSIASWKWAFGDSGTATGPTPSHTYQAAGTYSAKLSVVDNEGCGEELVFTGRTAYCSGSAPAVHPVTVKAPAVPTAAPVPSNNFSIKRIVHNRRNGTVRLQVRLPSAGYVLLLGKKVHAVTRKSKGVQTMWLTLHARVELAKRLKKILRAPVRFRITFTPNGGTAKTVHRNVTLQRAPRHKHSRR